MSDAKPSLHARNFPTAEEDAVVAASRYAGPGSAYRLAFDDKDFLLRDELRPVRMQLELLKPELVQREHGIDATVVVFGSARVVAHDVATAAVAAARDGGDADALKRAEMQLAMSRYYEEARRFGGIVTAQAKRMKDPIAVVTGGGPGVMEAGNRGAFEAGGPSIGLNIVLPHEQAPNDYITPELCFQFHYFALRKMHFLMRAIAIVAFPGGFGTLDELFEALTLMQTGKIRRRPVLLFGREFWTRLVDFDALVATGMISTPDLDLFRFVETADEAWRLIEGHYRLDATANGAAAEDL
ncbi:MAG TPA: TIGR00730 family Rossman fold protein [Methylibium sp.]|nr:TIGR00730 family Rossman fold protein [Methylibium sp.]HEU4458192.1 TIGR00730 family Rossman fold protein [Methylibium sp.]